MNKIRYNCKPGFQTVLSAIALLLGMASCNDYLPDASAPIIPSDEEVQVELSFGFADEDDGYTVSGKVADTRSRNTVQNGAFSAALAPAAQTRGEGDAPDLKPNALYNLYVLQYDAGGTLLKQNSTSGSTAIGTKLSYTLSPSDDCQLVVIACGNGNSPSATISGNLSNIQKLTMPSSIFENIPTSGATQDQMNKMPYILHLEHVKVTSDGKLQSVDGAHDARLLLKRLATKLTVNWKYNVSGYKLKQLLLQSVPLNYSIVDKPESDGTYPSLISQFTTLVATITDDNAASGACSWWIPANVRGESAAATSDVQRTKANAPTGSVFLNFVAGNTTDSKKKLDYRVYLGSGASTDFNVYRNKNYAYTVNFNHAEIPTNDDRVTYIDPIPASENNDNLVPTANCFMIAPGGAFCFDPFTFHQNGAEIINTQMTDWYSTSGTGIKSVKLLWQTKENGDVGDPVMGIANSNDDHTNIVDIKRTDGSDITVAPANNKGQCLIYCRVAANTSGGNGMIAAYDGPNGTGNIVWSWHVWVTDYNPDASGNVDVQYPANKRKQKYIGNSAPDQYPMMDRNLGAMCGYTEAPAIPLEQSKANGFHYQQGRKDPFPSSYSAEARSKIDNIYSSTPPKDMLNLYDADGITYKPRMRGSISNLREAYQNPIKLSTSNTFTTNQASGWSGNSKTLHDPCPLGWRVATTSNYRALFEGEYLKTSGSVTKFVPRLAAGFSWDEGEKYGGYLVVYDDKSNTTYFRMTGFGNNTTSFVIVGQAGNIWTRDKSYTFDFGFNANASGKPAYEVSAGWLGADAHNVRCIQEKE